MSDLLEAFARKQSSQQKLKRKKYVKKRAQRGGRRLTTGPRSSAQKKASAKHGKFMARSGIAKKISKFRKHESGTTHTQEYVRAITEAVVAFREELTETDAQALVKSFLSRDTAYSRSEAGKAALYFEAKMYEESSNLAKHFIETVVGEGDETFIITFDKKLTSEDLEELNDLTPHLIEVVINAGTRDQSETIDITIAEGTPNGGSEENTSQRPKMQTQQPALKESLSDGAFRFNYPDAVIKENHATADGEEYTFDTTTQQWNPAGQANGMVAVMTDEGVEYLNASEVITEAMNSEYGTSAKRWKKATDKQRKDLLKKAGKSSALSLKKWSDFKSDQKHNLEYHSDVMGWMDKGYRGRTNESALIESPYGAWTINPADTELVEAVKLLREQYSNDAEFDVAVEQAVSLALDNEQTSEGTALLRNTSKRHRSRVDEAKYSKAAEKIYAKEWDALKSAGREKLFRKLLKLKPHEANDTLYASLENWKETTDAAKDVFVRNRTVKKMAKKMKAHKGPMLPEAIDESRTAFVRFYLAENLSQDKAKKLLATYKSNEAKNAHSDNALLLARAYGSPKDVKMMQAIIKRTNKTRDISPKDYDWRRDNINPYYKKLVANAKSKDESVDVSEAEVNTLVMKHNLTEADITESSTGGYDFISDQDLSERDDIVAERGRLRLLANSASTVELLEMAGSVAKSWKTMKKAERKVVLTKAGKATKEPHARQMLTDPFGINARSTDEWNELPKYVQKALIDYYKKHESDESDSLSLKELASVITFDELVEYGCENGGNIHDGMPWSFEYQGCPVTHESDDHYLVTVPGKGTLDFRTDDVLYMKEDGTLAVISDGLDETTQDIEETAELKKIQMHYSKLSTKDKYWEGKAPKVFGSQKWKTPKLAVKAAVIKRDTSGGAGDQDEYLMVFLDKGGKIVGSGGSHPSLKGAKGMLTMHETTSDVDEMASDNVVIKLGNRDKAETVLKKMKYDKGSVTIKQMGGDLLFKFADGTGAKRAREMTTKILQKNKSILGEAGVSEDDITILDEAEYSISRGGDMQGQLFFLNIDKKYRNKAVTALNKSKHLFDATPSSLGVTFLTDIRDKATAEAEASTQLGKAHIPYTLDRVTWPQGAYEVAVTVDSKDAKQIAKLIKTHPDVARVDYYKNKVLVVMLANNLAEVRHYLDKLLKRAKHTPFLESVEEYGMVEALEEAKEISASRTRIFPGGAIERTEWYDDEDKPKKSEE